MSKQVANHTYIELVAILVVSSIVGYPSIEIDVINGSDLLGWCVCPFREAFSKSYFAVFTHSPNG